MKYNIKFLLLIIWVAAMGGFLFGYDWVVVGGAKPFYEPYFNITTPYMKGWGTSSALIGCVIGAIICFILSDKYGRRRLLILSGFMFALAAIGTAMSKSFMVYNLYRIVGGIGIGISLNQAPIYISEMSPAHLRGKFVSINQLMINIGVLAAQVANWRISLIDTKMPANATAEIISQSWNGQMGWRWMFGLQLIPATIFFLSMMFMPESVRFLVKNGQDLKARRILKRIGGDDYADSEVSSIKDTISKDEVAKVHFGELFKGRLFKIILLGIFITIFQQWCGMNVVFYYAADIFKAAGFDMKQMMLQIVVIGTVMILAVITTIFVIDKIGRKTLMLFGAGSLALIYIVEGYFFHIGYIGVPIIVLTLASVFCYSLTLAPVMWVILSEIFPNRIRGTAMSFVAVLMWFGNFSLTFLFPIINQKLGWAMNFWLYALICIIGYVVMAFLLPETKGKSLEQIEKQLMG